MEQDENKNNNKTLTNENDKIDDFGFIITRHVNSEITNKYWNLCIKYLCFFYPERKIIIIDDNSNPNFIKEENLNNKNIQIIKSEFPGKGELLPLYYYNKNKFFENAVIIHDSVFIHNKINFHLLIKKNIPVIPLWHFEPDRDNYLNTYKISSLLNNSISIQKKITGNDEGLLGLKQNKWYGCFGVQCFINHDFLRSIVNKYKIFNILKRINSRSDRSSLERIFGAIFFSEYNELYKYKSLFGNIYVHQKWGYNYNQYINDYNNKKINKNIIKVWTGR